MQLLGFTGWSHLHVRRSIGTRRKWQTTTNVIGWPDLLLWSPHQPGRHIAIELKVPPDDLSDKQAECIAELEASGFECHVIREEDLERLPGILRPPRQAD